MVTVRREYDFVVSLKPDEVFVFGSNLAGRHGAGAARYARLYFGARPGKGIGHHGQSYAIPTKDERIQTLPLPQIRGYVQDFIAYAEQHPYLTFVVSPIGCGLAGYTPKDIAPMFQEVLTKNIDNIRLPQCFIDVLTTAEP